MAWEGLAQSLNAPAFSVAAPDELIRVAQTKSHLARVPFQRGLWKSRRYAAQQHGFSQRPSVTKVSGGLAFAHACIHKRTPVVQFFQVRILEVSELRVRIQLRLGNVRQCDDAFRSNKD